MTSGGISIVLMLANPQTRTSRFHKAAAHSDTRSFRVSCLHHPNVVAGREVVPGAVKRQYVEKMIEKHCRVVSKHNPDDHTFSLDYPVSVAGRALSPGTVFLPDAEFMFRVMGEAPANTSDRRSYHRGALRGGHQPPGARHRALQGAPRRRRGRVGQRQGHALRHHDLRVWRARQFSRLDQVEYYESVKGECLKLARQGVWSLHVAADAGGGFGGGVVDLLRRDAHLRQTIRDFQCSRSTSTPRLATAPPRRLRHRDDGRRRRSAPRLLARQPPEELQADLTEREYDWVIKGGRSVKKLESKEVFRKRFKPERSPDDGDGFVLAVAPDHLLGAGVTRQSNYMER
jgi:hypothetical protein